MARGLFAVMLAMILGACMTTPVTMLENPRTGQIARCGGNTTNVGAVGYLSHQVREQDDERCVEDYEGLGFRPISRQQ